MVGDVYCVNSKGKGWIKNFYSYAQRFVTGMPYTHCAIEVEKELGVSSVFEADALVLVDPANRITADPNRDYEIYSIVGVDQKKIDEILAVLYDKYCGTTYGFLQILWFLYRRFMEVVFKKDVRKQRNPLSKGIICSELLWDYLSMLGEFIPELKAKISEWNCNTIHAGDVAMICKTLSCFVLEKKVVSGRVVYQAAA
jgi:hypothetical protein